MKKSHKNIVVGLSGGVDSAVSALLLKQQGYDVTGIFMQNWEVENDDPYCNAEQDLTDAKAVADHIGIDFHTVNFSNAYWDRVFTHCLDEFAAGRTPNPDVWCNKEIKFKAFLDYALTLGADAIATGHYARCNYDGLEYRLQKGIDQTKDQSYFLYMLGQQALSRSLFPLGNLQKSQVRQIAQEAGLINHNKKDSTGICFIGERKFRDFLKEFFLAKPGPMMTTGGQIISTHQGLMFYTIGQRKGLNIGGTQGANESPWYVVDKRIDRNTLVVGQGHNHPMLLSNQLICSQLHWISGQTLPLPLTCKAKTRYRQTEQDCLVQVTDTGSCEVVFTQPQWAITPGQSIVFYQDENCLGGGIIKAYKHSAASALAEDAKTLQQLGK